MGFWGIEVKPGKPYPYHSDNVRGTLHITQATLGLGSSKERSIVQCSVGHKKPIFLCALLPNKNESCPLDLEFDEDDLVAFSVIGPQSVHLSGYFVADEKEFVRDDYESDSLGEDIADTETDSSEYNTNDDYSEDDEESEDGFFVWDDNDYDMYQPSNVPKSGVVIEEIVDIDKPNRDDQTKRSKKKKPSSGSLEDTNSQHQIVVRRDASIPVMESEDEDGFPISITQKSESDLKFCVDDKTTIKPKKIAKDSDSASNSKRKVENVDEDGKPDSQNKKKKKKKKKQHVEEQVKENTDQKQPEENEVVKMDEPDHKSSNEKTTDVEMDARPIESKPENKKKKNKKKTDQENVAATNVEKSVTSSEQQSRSTLQSEQQQTEAKASKTRTFPNGLVVEEVAMGKPDGKRASPGKQVSVRYIGKLKNGKIFDSNVRGPPFKFRLGLGQVIAGWDVGVDGMRVGDKRRLTIPPSMGYGSKGAGGKIPPNSWLVFDVELIDVR